MIQRCFITGCDRNTEWQLPWFLKNIKKHCTDIPVYVFDFGMSEEGLEAAAILSDGIQEIDYGRRGWFKKVQAMMSTPAKQTVWLDTDCEVLSDPSSIFDHLEPGKLNMVKDFPWSWRRPELGIWHNSGVVGFCDRPFILKEWYKTCQERKDIVGDQEVLYWMMGGDELRRMANIHTLPHRYNVLRIDYEDGSVPENPVINHWTGEIGNLKIKELIENG